MKIRTPLHHDLETCIEFGVPVIITSYGNPTELAKRAHEKGANVVYTDSVSGVHANFIRDTVPGFEPASREVAQKQVQSGEAKRWRDIWSASQGIALAKEIKPIGAIVEDLVREYVDATRSLPSVET